MQFMQMQQVQYMNKEHTGYLDNYVMYAFIHLNRVIITSIVGITNRKKTHVINEQGQKTCHITII